MIKDQTIRIELLFPKTCKEILGFFRVFKVHGENVRFLIEKLTLVLEYFQRVFLFYWHFFLSFRNNTSTDSILRTASSYVIKSFEKFSEILADKIYTTVNLQAEYDAFMAKFVLHTFCYYGR